MAAPKGNKFALFNNGGRPPTFKNPEEMAVKIQSYFDSFFIEDEDLGQVMSGRPTVTGLVLHLGFCDKKSLRDYKEKEEFAPLIKKALTVVEMNYEEMLDSKGVAGAIFALKNMGWHDKVQQDVTVTEQPLFPDTSKNR